MTLRARVMQFNAPSEENAKDKMRTWLDQCPHRKILKQQEPKFDVRGCTIYAYIEEVIQ